MAENIQTRTSRMVSYYADAFENLEKTFKILACRYPSALEQDSGLGMLGKIILEPMPFSYAAFEKEIFEHYLPAEESGLYKDEDGGGLNSIRRETLGHIEAEIAFILINHRNRMQSGDIEDSLVFLRLNTMRTCYQSSLDPRTACDDGEKKNMLTGLNYLKNELCSDFNFDEDVLDSYCTSATAKTLPAPDYDL